MRALVGQALEPHLTTISAAVATAAAGGRPWWRRPRRRGFVGGADGHRGFIGGAAVAEAPPTAPFKKFAGLDLSKSSRMAIGQSSDGRRTSVLR